MNLSHLNKMFSHFLLAIFSIFFLLLNNFYETCMRHIHIFRYSSRNVNENEKKSWNQFNHWIVISCHLAHTHHKSKNKTTRKFRNNNVECRKKRKEKKNIGKCSAAMAIEIEKLKNTTLNNKQKANTDSRRIHYAILSCWKFSVFNKFFSFSIEMYNLEKQIIIVC